MDAKNLKIGLNTMLPLLLSVATIMGVYFTLKGKVTATNVEVVALKGDIGRLEKNIEKEHNVNKAQFKESRSDVKEVIKAISDLKYFLIKEFRHENTDSHGR